jgi:hypothetical protein
MKCNEKTGLLSVLSLLCHNIGIQMRGMRNEKQKKTHTINFGSAGTSSSPKILITDTGRIGNYNSVGRRREKERIIIEFLSKDG